MGKHRRGRWIAAAGASGLCALTATTFALAAPAHHRAPRARSAVVASTATPIKHVVVIFQENVSFDHYFGTYPKATNPAGDPQFTAAPNTPTVEGLSGDLLTNNPNGANPKLLPRSQPITCDQDHAYADEQKAYDNGKMDKFVATL